MDDHGSMIRRFLQQENPFEDISDPRDNFLFGKWPAKWIAPDAAVNGSYIACFRCNFTAQANDEIVLHLSADEHYEFMLDGELLGRGPIAGDTDRWFYDSYRGRITPGEHVLEAIVYFWGGASSCQGVNTRISRRMSFLLAAEGQWQPQLSTGFARWQCTLLPLVIKSKTLAVPGCRIPSLQKIREAPECGIAVLENARCRETANEYSCVPLLEPSPLPQMFEAAVVPEVIIGEKQLWQALLEGRAVVKIPAGAKERILLQFPAYVCAWMELKVSGGEGASVSCRWAEALFESAGRKKRHGADGSEVFLGDGDEFIVEENGKQLFRSIFWQAGRYLEITVSGGCGELTVEGMSFCETHYPIARQSDFKCDEQFIVRLNDLCFRTLEMCSHDTFMDCPYYERLQYQGDGRIEALAMYVFDRDDRLVQLALQMFARSRAESGLTLSRYPSLVKQIIPTFALMLPGMARENALWRGNPELHRQLLPRWREIIDFYHRHINKEGLVSSIAGWNFVDWAVNWEHGYPPVTRNSPSAVTCLLYETALDDLAALEEYVGTREFAPIYRKRAEEVHNAVLKVFHDPESGLFYDDCAHTSLSEHAQILALLSGRLDEEQRAKVHANLTCGHVGMAQCTVYFSHYLFEACRVMKETELFKKRLELWRGFTDEGFATVPERPEPTRSDCHAWGVHPYFHFLTTVLGIRPADWGFAGVLVAPMNVWEHAAGVMPHPAGSVTVTVDHGSCRVKLPAGTGGICRLGEREWQIPDDGAEHCFHQSL